MAAVAQADVGPPTIAHGLGAARRPAKGRDQVERIDHIRVPQKLISYELLDQEIRLRATLRVLDVVDEGLEHAHQPAEGEVLRVEQAVRALGELQQQRMDQVLGDADALVADVHAVDLD